MSDNGITISNKGTDADSVINRILGTTGPAKTEEYKSGFQLDPAGTFRPHNKDFSGIPENVGYHEVHFRPKKIGTRNFSALPRGFNLSI